jgi:hypothetical protein
MKIFFGFFMPGNFRQLDITFGDDFARQLVAPFPLQPSC